MAFYLISCLNAEVRTSSSLLNFFFFLPSPPLLNLSGKSRYPCLVITGLFVDILCCCCSVAQSCLIPCNSWPAAHQASLSFTISWNLLKLMSIELVMPSNHFILCCPLLLLPSIFPSIKVFSSESALCIRWPKYWSFSISPSSEYSGLIYFRIVWCDLLAVQGTCKSLLQHQSSKASVLQYSAFFMVQFLHMYMITGKTIALTR